MEESSVSKPGPDSPERVVPRIAPRDVRFSTGCLRWLFYGMGVILGCVFLAVGVAQGVPDGLPFIGFPLFLLGMMIYAKTKKTHPDFHGIELGSGEAILLVEENVKIGLVTRRKKRDVFLNNVVFTNQRVFMLAVNTIVEVYDLCSSGEDEIRLVELTTCADPLLVEIEPECVVLKPSWHESVIELRIFARDMEKIPEIVELWRRHSAVQVLRSPV